jgi:hypothetical protein
MHSIWIDDKQVRRDLERNEAFWKGELEQGPLMWVTVADAAPGTPPPEPGTDDEIWTDVQYVIEAAGYALHTRGTSEMPCQAPRLSTRNRGRRSAHLPAGRSPKARTGAIPTVESAAGSHEGAGLVKYFV